MRISVKGAGQDSFIALHWRCETSEPITCSELSKVRFDIGTHILSKCSELCVLAIPRWEKLFCVVVPRNAIIVETSVNIPTESW